ncbi:PREDICTED: uncharacterized protein LOC109586738 [Amphimedon queenslandica]|uniref:Uncharacterized protein n=1 Tax=Amphimedon queenslandica TaxID=400682 RepID=A0AAN0JNZ0_AMPQE|nr:PREDICTED: uncharacterized protein LOC109586738 [Amphimedon queenslandica]|eukprot:XP_019858503.1 PREDICTED: uncharacterized protein LOC109586738 [Amphimedon queenslandica]
MMPSLKSLANMSYQAKVVEIMAAHVHDIFNVSEEELKLLENESIEDEGNERFVGEEDVPHTQSKTFTIDDDDNKRLSLTPFSTPPEQRRHNMEELHEVAKEFDPHHLGTGGGGAGRTRVHSQPAMNVSTYLNNTFNNVCPNLN